MADWQTIVDQNRSMVWHSVYRILGHADDAADCFQETFINALELSRKEPVKNYSALLRRIALSRALDRLRRRARQKTVSADQEIWNLLPDDSFEPPRQLQQNELAQQLRLALAQLSPDQAQAFCLRFLDDLSYHQIARVMGIRTGAVGVLLHRARAQLQQLLAAVLAND